MSTAEAFLLVATLIIITTWAFNKSNEADKTNKTTKAAMRSLAWFLVGLTAAVGAYHIYTKQHEVAKPAFLGQYPGAPA